MSLSFNNVLIVGGAGYIGSHTAKAFRTAGMEPIVLDNLHTGNRFSLRFGPFYEGSISDAAVMRSIAEAYRPACAILFAGRAYVAESIEDPRGYFHSNVSETLRFLDLLVEAGVKYVVFSSSCSVYGIQKSIPIVEGSSKMALSPYAEAKLFVERALQWYGRAYGLRHMSLRYFNACGADPEGELGEHHDPETHLIPLTIYAAIGRNPLRVYGTDYETPDGTAVRDYTHVADLAAGHVRAIQYLMDGGEPLALNLGTGVGHSVRQVIKAVERFGGFEVPVEFGQKREGDAPVLVADSSLAQQTLGWAPKYSSIETIVRTAWQWHKNLEALALASTRTGQDVMGSFGDCSVASST